MPQRLELAAKGRKGASCRGPVSDIKKNYTLSPVIGKQILQALYISLCFFYLRTLFCTEDKNKRAASSQGLLLQLRV